MTNIDQITRTSGLIRNGEIRRKRSRDVSADIADGGDSETFFNVETRLKWFNMEKGYGFVTSAEHGDAFLHYRVMSSFLQDQEIGPDSDIICDIEKNDRGLNVIAIHNVVAAPPRIVPETVFIYGFIKFFDQVRGYGFVVPDNGGKDIFIHSKTVQAGGFPRLPSGAKVRVAVRNAGKGPEAISIDLVDAKVLDVA